MASKKITAMPDLGGTQTPDTLLTAVDLTQAPADQNVKSTLNDLFAYPTKGITDQTVRMTGRATDPAVSAADEAAFYNNDSDQALKFSENGSAYRRLIPPIYYNDLYGQLNPIDPADFTPTNLEVLTTYQQVENVFSVNPASGGLQLFEKDILPTPYEIRVGFSQVVDIRNFAGGGIYLRDSVGGRMVSLRSAIFSFQINVNVTYWTNFDTFDNDQKQILFQYPFFLYFFRLRDDGVTLGYDVSIDGRTYFNLFETASNTYCTPDKMGFFCNRSSICEGGIWTFYDWTES